jgi:hypothetical protein
MTYVPGISTRLEGQVMMVRYALTEDDLPDLFVYFLLQGGLIGSLPPTEQMMIENEIEQFMNGISLQSFVIEIAVDMVNQMITGLGVDIDVEFNDTQPYFDVKYDPEHPDADAFGFVVVLDELTTIQTIQLNLHMTMDLKTSGDPLVMIINKEEYLS